MGCGCTPMLNMSGFPSAMISDVVDFVAVRAQTIDKDQ
jgi:hypothetical protein